MKFFERLRKTVDSTGSRLCVGVDPHYYLTSPESLVDWSLTLAEKTVANAACFKVNTAFFEAYGHNGVRAMEDVVNKLNDMAPVILDAKRGDIPSTAEAYAQSVHRLNCDCITLNPFVGMDTIEPYLEYTDTGVFLLCHTSNEGANRFQRGISQRIAEEAAAHPESDRIGLVVGATQSHVMASIRSLAPFNWFLCPGIGKQNGSLDKTLDRGWGLAGNILISSSRSIAESDDPGLHTLRLKNQMQMADALVPPPLRELARLLIDTECVVFGNYALKSGYASPFYVDLRRLTGHPEAFKMAVDALASWVRHLKPQALSAIPMGGLTLASAVANQTMTPMCYARDPKRYGLKNSIEGGVARGAKLLLIDDVITKGTSALNILPKLGDYEVKDMLVLVDRQSGASNKLAENNINLHSVFKMEGLLWFWYSENMIAQGDFHRSLDFIQRSQR